MSGGALGPALQILLGLVAGAGLGLAHFASLHWVAQRYAGGGALAALAVQLARFAVLIAALLGLAKVGAAALLSGAVGLLVARFFVVRRMGGLS